MIHRTWVQQLGNGRPMEATPAWDQRQFKWHVICEGWGLWGKGSPTAWSSASPGCTQPVTTLFHDLGLETSSFSKQNLKFLQGLAQVSTSLGSVPLFLPSLPHLYFLHKKRSLFLTATAFCLWHFLTPQQAI